MALKMEEAAAAAAGGEERPAKLARVTLDGRGADMAGFGVDATATDALQVLPLPSSNPWAASASAAKKRLEQGDVKAVKREPIKQERASLIPAWHEVDAMVKNAPPPFKTAYDMLQTPQIVCSQRFQELTSIRRCSARLPFFLFVLLSVCLSAIHISTPL